MKLGQDIVLFVCIQLWIIKESDSEESNCGKGVSIVNICTDHELTMTSYAIIDTVNVPKFQQTFCECIIAPSYHGHDEVELLFYVHGAYLKYMQFKINDIVMESPYSRGKTYLMGETTLYFSTDKHYTKQEVCLYLTTQPQPKFNISCTKPKRFITTTLVTDTTTSVTSDDITTESSKVNITVSVTNADTTTDASKDNITKYTQRSSKSGQDSSGKLTATVVPTVIGALLILTVSVILLVYIKRRRLAKETRHHEQELHPTPALSEPVTEQGQDEQNTASGEECGPIISVNPYERLNMYVNENLAGEMYSQLNSDKNEEYQHMHDVKNSSRKQDRHFTKQAVFQEGKGQENNRSETSPNVYQRLNMYVNDTLAGEMYQQLQADKNEDYQEMHDVKNDSGIQYRHFTKETVFQEGKGLEENSNETSTNAYERLNMYVNGNLPGEMYQQFQADNTRNGLGKSVPVSDHRTIVKSDRKTDTDEITCAVYTNAIQQGDEYDDIA